LSEAHNEKKAAYEMYWRHYLGLDKPYTGTKAHSRFERKDLETWSFLAFVVGTAESADTLRSHLEKISEIVGSEKEARADTDNRKTFIKRVEDHRRVLAEAYLTRCVDNYLSYLSDLLFEIYVARPECLRSKAQERLDFVLSHSRMEDLIASLAEKQVRERSYSSIKDLMEYFERRLGLVLVESAEVRQRVNRLAEDRNLIVHNRGLVNRTFLKNTGRTDLKLGDMLPIREQQIEDCQSVSRLAIGLDRRAREKFSLADASAES
jgi:hypothetical protein